MIEIPSASSSSRLLPASIQPGRSDAEAIRNLVVAGRPLDACAYASRFAPFEAWTDADARRAAGWLCAKLGAPKRAQALELGTYRRFSRTALGRIVRLHLLLERRGPLAAWRALREEGAVSDATDEDRAEALLLEGHLLARFRDFDRAADAIRGAAERGASVRRVALFQAQILVERDRYADALDVSLRAAEATPDAPDVIGFLAVVHVLLGQGEEALDLLRRGAARTQSADVALQLVAMLEERKLWDERHEWIEQWVARVPLLERPERALRLRADNAYERGDVRRALDLLRHDSSMFVRRVVARMESTLAAPPAEAKRVLLDVPFVRQHHMTCAPATLSALATYWRMPAEHLEVAEAICYDGTPSHGQRSWAEAHGFVVREMTVTWDAARSLLDRGVPFTVATVEGGGAHLQAIVGYDERRGTLFVRDPFVPLRLEALAEEWLETWRATGPAGMVLVPAGAEHEGRLEGLELPDASLCEIHHRLHLALGRHDRAAARIARDELVAAAPGHRLAIAARRALAAYDQDAEAVLACAREMTALFPDFVPARLDALQCMGAVRSRDERITAAEELVRANPGEALYAEALARSLADDARQHHTAARLLRRATAARPDRHAPLSVLAEIAWDARRFEEAVSLRRFAACLGRFDEGAAAAYFAGASALGRQEEALALLAARVDELGPRAAGPVGTLYRALETMGRADEGVGVVRAALERRPEDGELLLLAVEIRGAVGDVDGAEELLARAQNAARETDWLRSAAQLALRRGAFADRKALLEGLLEREPLDIAAHIAYASAVAASDGPPAARGYLETGCARAPHLRPLAHVYLQWLRGAGAVATERAARTILARDPADDWTLRELANSLVLQGRTDEARASLALAAAVAPTDPSLEHSRALLFQREGRNAEARAALLGALELDPDRAGVIAELLSDVTGAADRALALAAVERIVHARSVTGVGIAAWYAGARAASAPLAFAESLEHLRANRPALAATWSVSIEDRSLRGDHRGALALADEACARFPLVSSIWLARGDALLAARRSDDALAALEHAVRVDALSVTAISRLAKAYLRAGDAERAKALLGRAIGRLPGSTQLRVELAELRWAAGSGERAKALIELEVVLALEAEHEHAWTLLEAWSTAGDDSAGSGASDALARLESLAAERPWSAHAALNVARAKGRRDDLAGALAAADRALELDPGFEDARDFRVVLLAVLGRVDDAEKACAPAVHGGSVPRALAGRAAWLQARRGDLGGACAAMRALLDQNADYVWGWNELARWERERGASEERLAAAKGLVAAAPRAHGAYRVLADALVETGDRTGARRALERAVDLAANEESVLAPLFDLLLEDDDLEAAGALVPLLRAVRPAAALAYGARLSARRGDMDRALEAFRALATDPFADAALIDRAHRGVVLAGHAERTESLVADLLADDAAHPSIGQIWVRGRLGRNELNAVTSAMRSLAPRRAIVRAAALCWLTLLRERGDFDAAREAARLVRSRFGVCDDALWAEVAASFLNGACEECVTWTADWRERATASSWMLLNVASALRETARMEEAFEVVRRAARLPLDGASRSHRTWLAFELAQRRDAVGAREWLTRAGDLRGAPLLERVSALTRATLAGARGLSGFGEARGILASVHVKGGSGAGAVQLAYARASRRVAADAGVVGTLWLHRATLRVVAVVAAIGLGAVLLVTLSVAPTWGGSSGVSGSPVGLVPLGIFALRMALGRSSDERRS